MLPLSLSLRLLEIFQLSHSVLVELEEREDELLSEETEGRPLLHTEQVEEVEDRIGLELTTEVSEVTVERPSELEELPEAHRTVETVDSPQEVEELERTDRRQEVQEVEELMVRLE